MHLQSALFVRRPRVVETMINVASSLFNNNPAAKEELRK
jgi:hypothetical protein